MFYLWIRMSASFQNIIEANQVAFHVSIRIGDRIAHTSLCCQIAN